MSEFVSSFLHQQVIYWKYYDYMFVLMYMSSMRHTLTFCGCVCPGYHVIITHGLMKYIIAIPGKVLLFGLGSKLQFILTDLHRSMVQESKDCNCN